MKSDVQKKKPIDDGIEANRSRIEPCEPRLALSASLAGDVLLQALDSAHLFDDSLLDDSPDPEPASNVIAQAADLRETVNLTGAGQTVAVIDSGVAWDHVALKSDIALPGFGPGYRVVGGWDFAENDSDPYDDGPAGYHGTHVAGVLAGNTNDFVGVAPEADIVSLRVFDDNGYSELEWIESALQWVHANQHSFESPITTVNLSVGAALSDANRVVAMDMLEDEFALLRQDNILVFAAAGNFFDDGDDDTGLLYPASSPFVVPVSSTDPDGSLSDFAQRESGIFATGGRQIVSSVPDHVFGWDGKVDDFAGLDGTSMATPQIAGASMLVRQAMIGEGLSPTANDILERMRDSSIEQIDPTSGLTYRTFDLATAVGNFDGETTSPSTLDHFDGSNSSDEVELDLRDGIVLRVGGVAYSLAPSANDAAIVIDVSGGDDTLTILGSTGAERLIASAGGNADGVSSLSTNAFTIELRGFENISFHGGGGPDRATLFDSPGSDTLESRPGNATLKGTGFSFEAIDVPRIYVHGIGGGSDVAFLQDSAGDDNLAVRPQFTSLKSDNAFQLAYGFERVYAYATQGGFDNAEIYDSVGDDTMSVSSGRSIITGTNYHVSASGFESTTGYASNGGDDIAKIYSEQTNSQWESAPDRLQWTGSDGAVRIARGFERTEAFEQFQAIQLSPQSQGSAPTEWWAEDSKTRAARDAEAARSVFADLGNQ
ncbi:S8 family peptidase [Rubripirellula reticaptiva]|nr:S8 family serine peptidase [Rubripirellula reticaptiva]